MSNCTSCDNSPIYFKTYLSSLDFYDSIRLCKAIFRALRLQARCISNTKPTATSLDLERTIITGTAASRFEDPYVLTQHASLALSFPDQNFRTSSCALIKSLSSRKEAAVNASFHVTAIVDGGGLNWGASFKDCEHNHLVSAIDS